MFVVKIKVVAAKFFVEKSYVVVATKICVMKILSDNGNVCCKNRSSDNNHVCCGNKSSDTKFFCCNNICIGKENLRYVNISSWQQKNLLRKC